MGAKIIKIIENLLIIVNYNLGNCGKMVIFAVTITLYDKKNTMHPLDKFLYCPACGSRRFVVNNVKSKHCEDCGFTYYANPSSATAAFIVRPDGCLLVARRAQEPAKGTLDLVGGFVDMDEDMEQGMLREIREETGLCLATPQYLFTIPNLYEYSGMTIHTLDAFFLCQVEQDAEPHAADDAAELLWIPREELDPSQFGLWSIRQAVERFQRDLLLKTVK